MATKYVPTILELAPMLVNTVLPNDVITYALPDTKDPADSTVVNLPDARATQFDVLGNESKFSLHVVPLVDVLVVLEPLAIATNDPPEPVPSYSKS